MKAAGAQASTERVYLRVATCASLDELNPARDLREREKLTAKLAIELYNELEVPGDSFSVLNCTSPDGRALLHQ